MKFYRDYLEELSETNGITRPIFISDRSFADSPGSTHAELIVFINAETNKNEYRIEFSHLENKGFMAEPVIDKVEKFERLDAAIWRFEEVNNVIYNILAERNAKGKKEDKK